MNPIQPPDYSEVLQSLMAMTAEEITARIKNEPGLFNATLYNQIRIVVATLQNSPTEFEQLRRVTGQVIQPISANTIQLFVTTPDKIFRANIAIDFWYLLNNQHAIDHWRQLKKTTIDAADKAELTKFIKLAKKRLHQLFLEENDPVQLLNYLQNHGPHLDTVEAVEHAASLLVAYEPWIVAMVGWGRWFINHINEEPKVYPDAAIAGMKEVIALLAGTEKHQLLADAHKCLGEALAQQRVEYSEPNTDSAIYHYNEALKFYTVKDYPDHYSNLQMILGIAYSKKNKPDRSANVETAIKYLYEAKRYGKATNGNIQVNLGTAYLERFIEIDEQQTNIRKAIGYYQEAITFYQDGAFNLGMLYNNLGIAYKQLRPFTVGYARNAINAFQAALSIRTEKDYPYEWAETLHNLGSIYGLLPNNSFLEYDDAVEMLNKALTVRTQKDYPYDWAGTIHDLAAQHISRFFDSGDHAVLDGVKELIDGALTVRTPEAIPYDSIKTSSDYGILLHQSGKFEEAIPYLQMSETAFDNINNDVVNLLSKSRVTEAYDYIFNTLISCYLNVNRVNDAFNVCIKMKGCLLAEKIGNQNEAMTSAESYRNSPEWTSIKKLTNEVLTIQDKLGKASKRKNADGGELTSLRQHLHTLHVTRKAEMERFSYLYPMEAASKSFYRTDHQNMIALAGEMDATIVEYYLIFDEWAAFIVTSSGIRAFGLGRADGLIKAFKSWTAQMNSPGGYTDEGTEKMFLSSLYGRLFKAFANVLPRGGKLFLSAQKELHQLPLHLALNKDNGKMLFETFDVSVITGSNVLVAMTQRKADISGKNITPRALFAMHPGDREKPLKYVQEEVKNIAAHFSVPVILDENSSSLKAITDCLNEYRPNVLHFSSHSVFNRAYPSLSGLQLKDFITVEAITAEMKITPGALVCLSSCQSSMSGVGPGDELTGLTQAFLQAGAGIVIGSLWLVNDRSTSMLFSEFYRQFFLCKRDMHEALRTAMLFVRDNGYRSMFFWGAFQVSGA